MRVDPPTNTISSILLLDILASRSTFSTGSMVDLNKSIHNSSNRARVMEEKKSLPSQSESISMVVWVVEDHDRFALSHAVLSRVIARALLLMSSLVCFLNSFTK